MIDKSYQKINRLTDEIEKVIFGKREIIQMTIVALLADGHILFEDIPVVGKTTLGKALALAINGSYNRIQFTPDLMPSDILGVSIYNKQNNQFEFQKGPIFSTVLLADEINRTTPKSQSALLESMSEKQVTIDNTTYKLPKEFFVLATQNPIDYEGTFPLPEAQLDRFLFKLHIGYPALADEMNLLMNKKHDSLDTINQVMSSTDIHQLKQLVENIYINPQIIQYALKLIHATRTHPDIALGISPRGSIAFVKAAKAFALIQGRDYVIPNDLQQILPATFGHRLIIKNTTKQTEKQTQVLLKNIIGNTPVPVGR